MLKKKITFKNLDDVEVTEEFYFNLTKAELMELDLKKNGLEDFARRIIDSTNPQEIYDEFKELLLISIGRRTGSSFVKNEGIRQEFAASEAYSELIIEMLKDVTVAAAFFNGIMPAEVREEVGKNPMQEVLPLRQDFPDLPEAPKTLEDFNERRRNFMHSNAGAEMPVFLKSYKLTNDEAVALDRDELLAGLKSGLYTT